MLEDSDEVFYAQARRILRFLLIGTDPETNEKLSAECIVRTPEVQRSLSLALDALEDGKRLRFYLKRRPEGRLAKSLQAAPDRYLSPAPKRTKPDRAGELWGNSEQRELIAAFLSGTKVKDLARLHKRTAGSITARLVHSGVCASRYDARAGLASGTKKPVAGVVSSVRPQAVGFGAE